jgi:nicotinamidase/pyrazinamidase
MITITDQDILIIVDPQNDFVEGGALAVPGGRQALSIIAHDLVPKFSRVVVTQDWHPVDHKSFASQHGVEPFSVVQLGGKDQVAWPDHCVQGSPGAELIVNPIQTAVVIRKGMNREIDSYSAFYENDGHTPTGLIGLIKARWGRKRVFFVGLARNYCVGFSVLDAADRGLGSDLYIVEDAVASIPDGTDEAMTARFVEAGVHLITTDDIA